MRVDVLLFVLHVMDLLIQIVFNALIIHILISTDVEFVIPSILEMLVKFTTAFDIQCVSQC